MLTFGTRVRVMGTGSPLDDARAMVIEQTNDRVSVQLLGYPDPFDDDEPSVLAMVVTMPVANVVSLDK